MRCLVTGATGYVGGQLVPALLERGHAVRCLTRTAGRLRGQYWSGGVESAIGDVADGRGLDSALSGIDVAYYLIRAREARDAARHFGAAARRAGVRRIVYLGQPEPGRPTGERVPQAEVARVLLGSGVPTTVLRTAMIIGSGSASFELLRHLTERLPVMVAPRWVSNRVEPIALRDLLRYLVASADAFPRTLNRTFAIGNGTPMPYAELMRRYAAVAELRPRMIIPIGVLTPALSAFWIGLVTAIPEDVARPLVASLSQEAVAGEHDIAEFVPDPTGGLTDFDTSVRLALGRVLRAEAWSGGTVYTDLREERVAAPPERLWRVVETIGGDRGWYSAPLAWAARGWLDRLVGGIGLRRGRPDPDHLDQGEAVDFWRVERIVPGKLLCLRAEMRLPGQAWLELSVRPDGPGRSTYVQRSVFQPRGLPGRAYWAAVAPLHKAVFADMARTIARTAEGL